MEEERWETERERGRRRRGGERGGGRWEKTRNEAGERVGDGRGGHIHVYSGRERGRERALCIHTCVSCRDSGRV